MAQTPDSIIHQIRDLIDDIERNNIPINQAVLFGSYAKGLFTDTSDIDIALVSDVFEGIRFYDRKKLNSIAIRHDPRFEIHPYKTSEFNPDDRWFVEEILKEGIRIK
jgi:predicted nucleotidyltransferase